MYSKKFCGEREFWVYESIHVDIVGRALIYIAVVRVTVHGQFELMIELKKTIKRTTDNKKPSEMCTPIRTMYLYSYLLIYLYPVEWCCNLYGKIDMTLAYNIISMTYLKILNSGLFKSRLPAAHDVGEQCIQTASASCGSYYKYSGARSF